MLNTVLIEVNQIKMQKTINQTENGKVFKCSSCNKIHIEYKNLNFNFDNKEYLHFAKYFQKLDGQYWEYLNRESPYQRKIQVPIGHKNLNILLSNTELQELKLLFSKPIVCQPKIISHFNYNIHNN
jgi:hypothetical protein